MRALICRSRTELESTVSDRYFSTTTSHATGRGPRRAAPARRRGSSRAVPRPRPRNAPRPRLATDPSDRRSSVEGFQRTTGPRLRRLGLFRRPCVCRLQLLDRRFRSVQPFDKRANRRVVCCAAFVVSPFVRESLASCPACRTADLSRSISPSVADEARLDLPRLDADRGRRLGLSLMTALTVIDLARHSNLGIRSSRLSLLRWMRRYCQALAKRFATVASRALERRCGPHSATARRRSAVGVTETAPSSAALTRCRDRRDRRWSNARRCTPFRRRWSRRSTAAAARSAQGGGEPVAVEAVGGPAVLGPSSRYALRRMSARIAAYGRRGWAFTSSELAGDSPPRCPGRSRSAR